jgi:hypothetical protein
MYSSFKIHSGYIQDTFKIPCLHSCLHFRYKHRIHSCYMLDKYGIHRVALQDTFYKTTSRSRTRGSGRGKGRFGGGRGGSAPVAVWPLLSTIESDAVYIVWHVGRGGARGARATWCANQPYSSSRSHRSFSRASRPRRACVAESVQILGSFVNSVGFPYGVFESEFQVEVDQRRSYR